jgi:REP element-mobilizing transposase RayT
MITDLESFSCPLWLLTAKRIFGDVQFGRVQLSTAGTIVRDEWLKTPDLRGEVRLDEWVVMPDHFQALIAIDRDRVRSEQADNGHVGGACWRPAPSPHPESQTQVASIQPLPRSLARVMNQFKATTTRQIRKALAMTGPVWQRGYHDRVVRSEYELDKVRKYIRDNPKNWRASAGPGARR